MSLLKIHDLRTSFETDRGVALAVDGLSLEIPFGKTIALVGESGCGKSVTALSILRLIPQPPGKIEGKVMFHDPRQDSPVNLLDLSTRELSRVRGGRIAMIFQEPASSLNPVFTIGEQLVEAVELHRTERGRAANDVAIGLLRQVGIPAPQRRLHDYPHRMSGGMLQRVMIAMALAGRPALLIADEPTTALDVTVQWQVLELLRRLQFQEGMSMLLITHDLGVVAEFADEVHVMYAGRIVEHAPVNELLAHPLHPYSKGLLECSPSLRSNSIRLNVIPGQVPTPERFPAGCRFHPRCTLTANLAKGAHRETTESAGESGPPILRRCVEGNGRDSLPILRELLPQHHVACWEASA